jgi:general secretion pathway protein A
VSAYRLWRALADRLAENRYQQIPTIVLLDDADAASPDVLDQAVRWTQLDASPGPGVTLIAAADPRRVGRLGSRLLELAELRVDLDPWEPQETSAYVRGALAAAGGSGDEFQEEALARLHELTGGVPRQVQQLGDLALVAGAGRRLRQIDAETVSTACYELGLVSTAAR